MTDFHSDEDGLILKENAVFVCTCELILHYLSVVPAVFALSFNSNTESVSVFVCIYISAGPLCSQRGVTSIDDLSSPGKSARE